MIFGKAINRYYLKHAPVLLLGILSLLTVEIVTTCHGMNLPDACKARLAAFSSPPQQGTSMRTTVARADQAGACERTLL